MLRGIAEFALFWVGAVTSVIGSMILFNGAWAIFARWFEINFPSEAGIQPGGGITSLWIPVVQWNLGYVAAAVVVAVLGAFMVRNGRRRLEGPHWPLVEFAVFWAGVSALAIGLGTFLYGLIPAEIQRWYEINFPGETWVPEGVRRGLWYPAYVWNMPYIFAGLATMTLGLVMVRNGRRIPENKSQTKPDAL